MDVAGLSSGTPHTRASHDCAARSPACHEHDGRNDERHAERAHTRDRPVLGVLRREMRSALIAHFRGYVPSARPAYAAAPASGDEVAAEVLDAARLASAASPATAADTLIALRMRIRESATYVGHLLGAEDAVGDVVAGVDEGLEALGEAFAHNRESTASVLHVDTRRKERTAIRIRTQDGDVVTLKLKQYEAFVADRTTAGDDGQYSELTTALSRRGARLMLKVEGDLDAGELDAIRNVLTQAAEIASEFFDGDLSAALDLARNVSFDGSELARVGLRFGVREVTNLRYAETQAPAPGPAAEAASPSVAPSGVAADDPVTVSAPPAASAAPDAGNTRLGELLAGFLRTVRDGFAAANDTGSTRLHFSERFKLDLLRAVVDTAR